MKNFINLNLNKLFKVPNEKSCLKECFAKIKRKMIN